VLPLKSLLQSMNVWPLGVVSAFETPARTVSTRKSLGDKCSGNPPIHGLTSAEHPSLTPSQMKEIERRAVERVNWIFAGEQSINLEALSDNALFAMYAATKADGR